MADLDQLLERAATRLQPTSDAWERMQGRATRRRRRRRVEAFAVATLVGIAGVGIAVGAFDSGPNTPAPATLAPIVPRVGNGLIWAIEGSGETGIYLSTINPATGASQVLFNDGIRPAAGGVTVLAAIGRSYAWSPDGKLLALSAYSGKGSKIYLLPPNGMSRTQVTFGGGLASYPSWSPDGTHIAYASDSQPATGPDSPYYTPGCELSLKLCPQQIRVTNANPRANSLARQLTHDPVGATMPSWSPDGQRIAFVGGAADPNGDICVMDVNGHNVRPLTSGPAYDSFPKWSPDGTKIAFLRAGSGQPNELWIMNADGTNPHPLAASGPQTGSFAWSPDGTELAFATQTGITLITPSGEVLRAIAVSSSLGGVGDLVWRPLLPSSSASPSPSDARNQPKGWIVSQAAKMASSNGDPTPTSSYWVFADSSSIAPVVGLTASGPFVVPKEYLVVLHGSFTSSGPRPPGVPAPRGNVLAFTLDPKTHQVLDLSVGNQTVFLPGLTSFSLHRTVTPSHGSIPAVSVSPSGRIQVPGFTIWAVQEAFGSLWVGGSNGHSEQILRLDPTTGAVQHLFPAKQLEAHEWGGNAFAVGGGMVWAATGSQGVERIDPTTNTMSIVPVSTGGVIDVAFDGGSLWVNTYVAKGSYAVSSLDPSTDAITGTWPFTAGWSQGVYPAAGTVWVHEHLIRGGGVSGGSVNQVVPGAASALTIGGSFAEPVTDGQSIYTPFSGDPKAMNLSHGIAQVDPSTGAVLDRWKSDPLGYDMTLGPDGSIWYLSGSSASAVLERLDPSTGLTDVRQHIGGNPVAVTMSGSTVWVVQYGGWLDRFAIASG